MSPTIVLQQGRPIMTLGAAGGPKIITQVVLAIINHLDLNQPLDQAVAAPRFHHQWSPDVLYYESDLAEEVVAALRERGHELRSVQHAGITQAVVAAGDDAPVLIGVADTRVPGRALGLDRDELGDD